MQRSRGVSFPSFRQGRRPSRVAMALPPDRTGERRWHFAICALGLAGFVSPYLVGWIGDLTHRLDVGLYVIAFCLFLGALLVIFVVPVNLAGAITPKKG
jgi:MFS-type transporter involved in bile tolerance (Atg22 family)